MQDKCLVTGGAGFIGSAIAHRLVASGYKVTVLDSITSYYDTRIKEARVVELEQAGVRVVRADLNVCDLEDLTDDVSFIYHQAGQPGVRPSWGRSFDEYVRQNINSTQRLLEHCRSLGSLKKFVYASSSSVYGDAAHYPSTELSLPRPKSPYGVTKLAGENLCVLYARNYDVPTVSLRYFTVYGPGQRPDMAFNKFIFAALNGRPIPVYGDGSQLRDFTYVDDVVAANLAAGESFSATNGQVYNVCGGSTVSLAETLDLIGSLSGLKLVLEYHPPVPGDVFQTGGDARKILEAVGWSPMVGIEHGLAAEVEWARSIAAASER